MFRYPCDMSLCTITDTWADHLKRPGYEREYAGNDIASYGAKKIPLFAAIDGVVGFAGWDNDGFGNRVIISNDSAKVLTAHMDSCSVHTPIEVVKGQMIGLMGTTGNSTGVHAHFGTWIVKDGAWLNIDAIGEGLMEAIDDDTAYESITYDLPEPIELKAGDVVTITAENGLFTHVSPDIDIATRDVLYPYKMRLKVHRMSDDGKMACIKELWVYSGYLKKVE